MDHGQITIESARAGGCESSTVWIFDWLPLCLFLKALRCVVKLLTKWSGLPLENVSSVVRKWGTWFGLWTGSLSVISGHPLKLHHEGHRIAHGRWSD